MAGRIYKTTYSAASGTPAALSTFDAVGRPTKQTDPDGVATLRQYNARSEPEVSATLLVSGASTIDFTKDRITRTVSDVTTNAAGVVVRRSRTFVCDTDASGASNLVSTTENSLDGRRSWSSAHGRTNGSVTVYLGGGYRQVTNTAPDNSRSVSVLVGASQFAPRSTGSTGMARTPSAMGKSRSPWCSSNPSWITSSARA